MKDPKLYKKTKEPENTRSMNWNPPKNSQKKPIFRFLKEKNKRDLQIGFSSDVKALTNQENFGIE